MMKQKFSDYAGEMFDRLPDAIAVADQQRIIREVNPAFLELFGYSEEEIVGQSTAVLYADPEDFARQGQSRFNATASSDDSEYIMRYQTADGVVFHGATIGVPLTNGNDKHVGFMGSIRDVTDRVLRQQGMSAILELTASASDPDYKLRELLRLGCEHFGLDLGIISAVDGDRYEVLRAFDPTGEIQAGQVFAVGESFTRDVLNSAAPLAFHDASETGAVQHPCYQNAGIAGFIGARVVRAGKVTGTISFSSAKPQQPFTHSDFDIMRLIAGKVGHELDRLDHEEALETSRDQALKADKVKSEFLAVVSHELRTPMNAILGATQALRTSELDDWQAQHLDMIGEGGGMLLTLLNDLLDLSKIEAGKMTIEVIPLDPSDLLEKAQKLWDARARDKGLSLHLSIHNAPDAVMGDPTRLRQILFNLISNAVKFTSEGEIAIRADFEEAADEEWRMTLSVTDSGPGVPAEARERIFEAFEQTDHSISRKYGGTGLGLPISRKLAQAMDGDLVLADGGEQGATFTLTVPLGRARLEEAETKETLQSNTPRGLKVLVVEDVGINHAILEALLRTLDYRITQAWTGLEALNLAESQDFDLVLMDMGLPELDGLETTRRLRASGGINADTPVVGLTANTHDDDKKKCLNAGMDGYAVKPIDIRALFAEITRVVNAAGRRAISADQANSEVS